jgi:hypothetical protein
LSGKIEEKIVLGDNKLGRIGAAFLSWFVSLLALDVYTIVVSLLHQGAPKDIFIIIYGSTLLAVSAAPLVFGVGVLVGIPLVLILPANSVLYAPIVSPFVGSAIGLLTFVFMSGAPRIIHYQDWSMGVLFMMMGFVSGLVFSLLIRRRSRA